MPPTPPITDVTELPDYPTLKKLAAALWQQENSFLGAAVLVGAGFSRSAATAGDRTRKLPLWNNLALTLADDLGESPTTDPLRLAEEYCAYFGKQALHETLVREICDAAWTPGPLYKALLELGWSEVLTTNWDTLLERAALDVHRVYSVVHKQEDLSTARSPRIVKLHGTVNITTNLVFTQEDYRKYPRSHAAFVNFARQVFIENELCLVGFSGDDPNFLQWAGWVRDHLATQARRIYLVGPLHLPPSKRKYLESINVAPIDLNPLVAHYDDPDAKHREANRIFIEALKELQPKRSGDWRPKYLEPAAFDEDSAFSGGRANPPIEQTISHMVAERLSYPDWLVCPPSLRLQLDSTVGFRALDAIPNLAAKHQERLLYEIMWRHATGFEAASIALCDKLSSVCDPATPCSLSIKEQMEIALFLLKNTRWLSSPESESLETMTSAILAKYHHHWPESANEVLYHRALKARDRFEYTELSTVVDEISDKDPLWKLRKASLLAELGRFDEGESLIHNSYRELLVQHRSDRTSMCILSRLAWAHWMLRSVSVAKGDEAFETFPPVYQEKKCSPWDQVLDLQDQIKTALENQQKRSGIEPEFEPGRYRDNSRAIVFSSQLHPLHVLHNLSATGGMPLRWNGVGFLVQPASQLVRLNGIGTKDLFSLALRAAESDTSEVVKRIFSRMRIATLSTEEADYLVEVCLRSIGHWEHQIGGPYATFAFGRLQVFIEVLARVSVRGSTDQAKRIFALALSMLRKERLRHFWLFDPLNHMIEYALASIPTDDHREFLLDALLVPLRAELDLPRHERWPNPVITAPGDRQNDAALDRRIDEIIEMVAPDSSDSSTALVRLLPLLRCDFLREPEKRKLAQNIWGKTPTYSALPITGLFSHVLLQLPSSDQPKVERLLRDHLCKTGEDRMFDSTFLTDLIAAAQAESFDLGLGDVCATKYFDLMVEWRLNEDQSPLSLHFSNESNIARLIGHALADAVIPAMHDESLTEQRFEKLQTFHHDTSAKSSILALATFSAREANFTNEVEKLVNQGLWSLTPDTVALSSHAILRWRELTDAPTALKLVTRLISQIGSSRMTAMQALLWTANQLFDRGYLGRTDKDALAEALPMIFDYTNYQNISPSSSEAISVSLTRAACVRLAAAILHKEHHAGLQHILDQAISDPLQEVRLAV